MKESAQKIFKPGMSFPEFKASMRAEIGDAFASGSPAVLKLYRDMKNEPVKVEEVKVDEKKEKKAESVNLKDKTCLILDTGAFTFLAERLARDFGKVKYFNTTWKKAFPTSDSALTGVGLDGVEVVKDYADHVESSDIIVFFDIYFGDIQKELKAKGKAVYGAGTGEQLERDRWFFLETLKKHGLHTPPSIKLKGIDAIREHLKKHDDKYIKGSEYRGDFESFHHIDYRHTRYWLDDLVARLGAKQDIVEMIIQDPVEAVAEMGIDSWIINGKFPDLISWGVEVKDESYLSVLSPLPKPLKMINDKTEEMVKGSQYTGSFANEVRITKDGDPYFLDFTARQPLPPSALMCEWFSNFSNIVWDVAHGIMPTPEPIANAKYGAELLISSEWLIEQKRMLAVDFPKEERQWFKPFYACDIDGLSVIPLEGNRRIGSVIGFGNTADEAIKACMGRAKLVKAIGADFAANSFDKAKKSIEEAKKIGIEF